VRIDHEESNGVPWTGGTSVEVPILDGVHYHQAFHPRHWVRSFAAFNPHATFRYLPLP